MPEQTWEKSASRDTGHGPFATVIKIMTLGIGANPEPWEVEYTNRTTGAVVRGTGATEADADAKARSTFLHIDNTATEH